MFVFKCGRRLLTKIENILTKTFNNVVVKFCEILTYRNCNEDEIESKSHFFLTAFCVRAVQCVPGSRHSCFRRLLDHPNAGDEPRRPGTEIRIRKENLNMRENKHLIY
jgi:hypothetical protein